MNTLEPTHPQPPEPFYLSVLEQELRLGRMTTADKILVTCGGNRDRLALLAAGFTDVVITNLAPHHGHADYHPYSWEYQDIESLTYEDGAFDVVIVHSGLHHCYNPIRALGELYRVARKQMIAFEPYETWFTRLGAFLGYGQEFEDLAVHTFGGLSGGVANTEIPNLVYRFNEREVRKFARAFRPWGESPIRFYRALRMNIDRFRLHGSWLLRTSFKLAYPIITVLARVFKPLNNNLCFVIQVPEPANYHPWIRESGGKPRVDPEYLQAKYGKFPCQPRSDAGL